MTWLGHFKLPTPFSFFDSDFHRPMNWFHVSVEIGFDGSRTFKITDPDDLEDRPKDANPEKGNPYTPWYQKEEHIDENHVHIYAQNAIHAIMRAKQLYDEEFGHEYIEKDNAT